MQKSTQPIFRSWFLDIFFPRHCLGCRMLISSHDPDHYVCAACTRMLPFLERQRCAFCLAERPGGTTCKPCATRYALDALLVTADYQDGFVVRMVKGLKYRFIQSIAKDMGHAMAKRFSSLFTKAKGDLVLVPIPLHSRRLRWRGFNQAELIARALSEKTAIPVCNDILIRTRSTQPQAEIENRADRMRNVEGIFALSPPNPLLSVRGGAVAGAIVLLIDDVATTGATLDNAARVLKNAGAKHVMGMVFARG